MVGGGNNRRGGCARHTRFPYDGIHEIDSYTQKEVLDHTVAYLMSGISLGECLRSKLWELPPLLEAGWASQNPSMTQTLSPSKEPCGIIDNTWAVQRLKQWFYRQTPRFRSSTLEVVQWTVRWHQYPNSWVNLQIQFKAEEMRILSEKESIDWRFWWDGANVVSTLDHYFYYPVDPPFYHVDPTHTRFAHHLLKDLLTLLSNSLLPGSTLQVDLYDMAVKQHPFPIPHAMYQLVHGRESFYRQLGFNYVPPPHIGTRGNPDHTFVLQTFQCALERHVEWDAFVAFCDRYSKMNEDDREEIHRRLSEALRWNDVDRVVGLFVGG